MLRTEEVGRQLGKSPLWDEEEAAVEGETETPDEAARRQRTRRLMSLAAQGCADWSDTRLVLFLIEWTPELAPATEYAMIAATARHCCQRHGAHLGHQVWRRRMEQIAGGGGCGRSAHADRSAVARLRGVVYRQRGEERRRRCAMEALHQLQALAAPEGYFEEGAIGVAVGQWRDSCLASGFPPGRFRGARTLLAREELVEHDGHRGWRITPAGFRALRRPAAGQGVVPTTKPTTPAA